MRSSACATLRGRQTCALLAGTAAAVLALVFADTAGIAAGQVHRTARAKSATSVTWTNQKRVCVYDVNSISGLTTFAHLVGRRVIDCGMVYTGSPDWAGWTDPWFLHHPDPDLNWAAWVRQSPPGDRRQLIISQPLIPSQLAGTDWRAAGAAGAYEGYARQFARNLIADGVSDAVIRLSWEMNGGWNIDNIGDTRQQMSEWVRFWRNTVRAMRSVPGAHFKFVWCVNNIYQDIPLSEYYPGDDVVDIIGDDVYDAGVKPGQARWEFTFDHAGGFAGLIAFAKHHNKPLSIPEWGVGVPNSANLAGGDDPAYIRNIANVVAHNETAFQTYFYAHEWATQLQRGRRSLAAYRAAFGDHGYAAGSNDGMAPRARRTHSGNPPK